MFIFFGFVIRIDVFIFSTAPVFEIRISYFSAHPITQHPEKLQCDLVLD